MEMEMRTGTGTRRCKREAEDPSPEVLEGHGIFMQPLLPAILSPYEDTTAKYARI